MPNKLKQRERQEYQLFHDIYEYEAVYFDDMTFQVNDEDSILREFLYVEMTDLNTGTTYQRYDDTIAKLSSLKYWISGFYVKDLPPGFAGAFNNENGCIEISPEHINDKVVILHEMIHAYIYILSQVDDYYRDVLFLCLYKNLSSKIEDLDKLILYHNNTWHAEITRSQGGSHGILFYLKSLDLDLRCGYELGTVYRYKAL